MRRREDMVSYVLKLPIMKPDTSYPIHITPHHLTLSPSLTRWVSDRLGDLSRIAGDILIADVVLRGHHNTCKGKLFSASARIALPGRDLHAVSTHADLYAAITELRNLLRRSLRKRKTAIGKRKIRAASGRPGRETLALSIP